MRSGPFDRVSYEGLERRVRHGERDRWYGSCRSCPVGFGRPPTLRTAWAGSPRRTDGLFLTIVAQG